MLDYVGDIAERMAALFHDGFTEQSQQDGEASSTELEETRRRTW